MVLLNAYFFFYALYVIWTGNGSVMAWICAAFNGLALISYMYAPKKEEDNKDGR